MTTPVIKVEHLTKRFKTVAAVDDVSFAVLPGMTTGLLGGNGAGKTTTITMLLGLLLPTSGSIRVLGEDMVRHRHRVLPRLNFSSPYVDLPHRLTVSENLNVYARLYAIRQPAERIRKLAADLDFAALLGRKTGNLSSGQKTRIAIAKALLNEPELLLLDEPTASLDPDTADWVRRYLRDYQSRSGASILLASHNMAEVEQRYGRSNLEEVFLHIARSGEIAGAAAQ
jgi:ABC-2 type transport system ATP-binding protein